MSNRTMSEMRSHILAKAAEDMDFRAQLLADPKSALTAELEIPIPEAFKVHVYEDSASAAHFVLPPSPKLTEADLAQVASGGWKMAQDSMDQWEDEANNP